ncbi:uncharacterized protein DUF4232 [Thermomonospora umbrina]|uniref:Uncharacterized protein DUF4232 n=2 Tax=Thermomonospora umbrina TaxID=111806 RepID=A0A3D9SSA7_9ACTN|nr:uncharacterized protein DUF4232 [Thermomonospora umbrina]
MPITAVALALAACSGSDPTPKAGGPTTTAAATPTVAACPEPGVMIRQGTVEAAMGLRVMGLEMVNCGDRAYTVHGYPDLRVLDAENRPINVRVSRGSAEISRIETFEAPPEQVELRPGETARAMIVWRNTVTDGTVPAARGARLDIAPVAGTARQTVALDEGGIDLGTTGRLGTSPWLRD